MAKKLYGLTAKDRKAVDALLKRNSGGARRSSRPTPTRRRSRPSGGSGSTIRFGRVTTAFAAATGPLSADWADGEVQLEDDATGADDGSPIACKNRWPLEFGVDYVVTVFTSFDPPRLGPGTCAPP